MSHACGWPIGKLKVILPASAENILGGWIFFNSLLYQSSHGFSASMKGKTTSGIKGPADGAFSTAEALYGKLSDSVTVKCKKKKITKTVLFVFPSLLHLSDAFIQSNLQCIQAIHLYFQYVYSLGIEPTTFALLMQCSNHWATGTTGATY